MKLVVMVRTDRSLTVRKVSFAHMNCSIAQSLEIIGEWWTLLVIRDAFLGVRRFDDFVERLGISRNVLTNRLDTLVEAGVLERHMYDEGRGRADYILTAKGRALWPVVATLREWGDEWVLGEGNEPVVLKHQTCGEVTHLRHSCDRCGEELDASSVRAVAGPAAGPDSPIPRRSVD